MSQQTLVNFLHFFHKKLKKLKTTGDLFLKFYMRVHELKTHRFTGGICLIMRTFFCNHGNAFS